MIALQVTSVVIMIKYSLLKTYSLSARDIFVSKDLRTKHMDVENALDEKARSNAESLRAEISSVEDMLQSGDIKGLLQKVVNIKPVPPILSEFLPAALLPNVNQGKTRNL